MTPETGRVGTAAEPAPVPELAPGAGTPSPLSPGARTPGESGNNRGRRIVRRGKDTERAVVNAVRRNGFPHADRVVRTGYRTQTRVSRDQGDVTLCPGVIVQVKTYSDAGRMERAVPAWMVETEAQREAAGAAVALLVVRRNGTADVTGWWAWLWLSALLNLHNSRDIAPWYDAPMRMLFGDAVKLLRAAGYGEPP